jgi:hypothetical protein
VNGSGFYVFYPVGTVDSLPGVKQKELEANHEFPCSAEVYVVWNFASMLPGLPLWHGP